MPSTPAVPGRLARRTLLRAALAGGTCGVVVAAVSGCRLRVGSPSGHPAGTSPGGSGAAADPDRQALTAAAASAAGLQRLYGQAALVRPDLAAPLGRLGADHAAHVRALAALGATASPEPVASPPPTAGTALSVLARAERTAATARLAGLAPLDGRTARLLGSLGACSSAHVVLLARLPARRADSTPAGSATRKAGA